MVEVVHAQLAHQQPVQADRNRILLSDLSFTVNDAPASVDLTQADALVARFDHGDLVAQACQRFADYADLCFERFGDRVKHWITLNEPWEHAMMGHFLGEHAPGMHSPWTYFKVAHHELLGHGMATLVILLMEALIGAILQHQVMQLIQIL